MKKLLSIIACIMVVSAFALTACDSSNDDTSSVASSSAASTSEASSGSASSEADDSSEASSSSSDGMTIQEYVEQNAEQLDSISSSFEGTGINMDILARGNSLVYSCQYTMDIGDTDLIKSTLDSSLDASSSTYESVLSLLKLQVPSAESVIVEYLDMDGNVITSKEYK